MARPEIKGLKYFPLDAGLFRDKKIRLLRVEHGADGVEVYLRLIAKCYENDNGYFLSWDSNEDFALLADETGYSKDKIQLIVSTCLRRSLFDDTLFEMGNVLTSRGIQRRYFEAIKSSKIKAAAQGRHMYINEDLCLLTEEDFSELNKTQVWLKVAQNNGFSQNNYDKSQNNLDNSPNNPLKEMKGNERKEKKSKGKELGAAAPSPTNSEKRHKYGEFGWVLLSNAEYTRLVEQYKEPVVQHYIKYIDESAQQTGNKNKWKDWNLTVRKAIRNQWGPPPPTPPPNSKKYDNDEDFLGR